MAQKEVNFNATLPLSGSLTRQTTRSLTLATLRPVGNLAGVLLAGARTYVNLEAALSFSGSVAKGTARHMAAFLPFAGTYPEETLYPSESLFPGEPLVESGSLTKQTWRAMPSTLALTGTVARRTSRGFSAAAAFMGRIAKRRSVALEAVLSFVGSSAPVFHKFMALVAGRTNPKSRSGQVNPATLIELVFPAPDLYPSRDLFPSQGRIVRGGER